MKRTFKKTYIQPTTFSAEYVEPIMQMPASMHQGNGDDPIVDDEDDILSKDRKNGWGTLW